MWQRFIGNQLTEAVIRICQTFDRIIGQTDKLLPFINQQKTNVHILVSRNRPFYTLAILWQLLRLGYSMSTSVLCAHSLVTNSISSYRKKWRSPIFLLRKVKCSEPLFFLFRWTKCWDSLLANVSRIFDFYHVYIATDCINKSITFSYIIHEIAYQKCFHPRYCSLSTNEIVTFYRWHAAWKTPTTHSNG